MADAYRQHVPRPPGPAATWPPPWAGRAGADPVTPAVVRAALAPPAPVGPVPAGRPVEAAVLVALYPDAAGEATALLIRRAAHLGRDPGHVALPGGLVEPGEDLLAAALREADEEIGLDPAAVDVVGALDVVERPRRGAVAAFVGLLADRPALVPSPDEVDAVLDVPLATLLADRVAWEERWPLSGSERAVATAVRPVRFFACDLLGDDLVWGVTAHILWDLLERVERVAARGAEGAGRPRRQVRLD